MEVWAVTRFVFWVLSKSVSKILLYCKYNWKIHFGVSYLLIGPIFTLQSLLRMATILGHITIMNMIFFCNMIEIKEATFLQRLCSFYTRALIKGLSPNYCVAVWILVIIVAVLFLFLPLTFLLYLIRFFLFLLAVQVLFFLPFVFFWTSDFEIWPEGLFEERGFIKKFCTLHRGLLETTYMFFL